MGRYTGVSRQGRKWRIRYQVPGLGQSLDKRRADGSWMNEYTEVVSVRTAKEAAAIRRQRLEEIDRGTWNPRTLRFRTALAPKLTFGALVDRFLSTYKPRSGSIRYYRERANIWLRHIDPGLPAGLSFDEVERFRNARLQEVGDSTVKKDLTALATLYKWAIARELVTGRNPADAAIVKRPPEPLPQGRHYSDAELDALLATAPAWLGRMVRWGVGTGMDRGEILALTWGQVDLDIEEVRAPRTKSLQPRKLPIDAELRGILDECSRLRVAERAAPVFLDDRGRRLGAERVKTAMRRAFDEAGLKGKGLHAWKSLRHRFNFDLRRAGVGPEIRRDLLGHRHIQQGETYGPPDLSEHRAAMERRAALRR